MDALLSTAVARRSRLVDLIQAFSSMQILNPDSEFTIVKKDTQTGQVEIIEKNKKEIKVKKMSSEQKSGAGLRLGVAYQLPDGSVVYVPEEAKTDQP